MKKICAVLTAVIVSLAALTIICGCNPILKYPSMGIEPKTAYVWRSTDMYSDDAQILRNYKQYVNYGVDLGYGEKFFDSSDLLIIVKIGCTSNAYVFADILAKDNVIYPIIAENKTDDAITDDIISHVFYAELPQSGNYSLGKIVYQNSKKAHFADRSLTALNLRYAALQQTPARIEVGGLYNYTVYDETQMRDICDILLARTYRRGQMPDDPPALNLYLNFIYDNDCGDIMYFQTDYIGNYTYNVQFCPKDGDRLLEILSLLAQEHCPQ